MIETDPAPMDEKEIEVQQHLENDPEDDEEPIVLAKTWVVVFILSMGYGLSFWPIPVFAAIEANLAAEFGAPESYIWWIPSWSLAITTCFLIAYVPLIPLSERMLPSMFWFRARTDSQIEAQTPISLAAGGSW